MIDRFNLIYHVAPFLSNDAWKPNLAQLKKRLHRFNGQRWIGIAAGEGLHPPSVIIESMRGWRCEFLVVPNSVTFRECTTFNPMMEKVQSTNPNEATFYAHAKGVSTSRDPVAVTWWRNAMYAALLDDWQALQGALERFPIVGTYRMNHPGQDMRPLPAGTDWHFSGTFLWFRNADVFSREWKITSTDGWALEAWPAQMFRYAQSCCLHADAPGDRYSRRTHLLKIDDEEPKPGLKIELGGGDKPKAGFLNIDLTQQGGKVDLLLDLEAVGRGQTKLPFDDDSVSEVYTSHFLEHIDPYNGLLHELMRVCRVGATIEIRVPHWNQQMARCASHKHVVSPDQIGHWCGLPEYWFPLCKKRVAHERTEYVPKNEIHEARKLFPHMTDEQIMRYVPDTCHENAFFLRVVDNT